MYTVSVEASTCILLIRRQRSHTLGRKRLEVMLSLNPFELRQANINPLAVRWHTYIYRSKKRHGLRSTELSRWNPQSTTLSKVSLLWHLLFTSLCLSMHIRKRQRIARHMEDVWFWQCSRVNSLASWYCRLQLLPKLNQRVQRLRIHPVCPASIITGNGYWSGILAGACCHASSYTWCISIC